MAIPYINAGMAAKNVPVKKPLPTPLSNGPYKGYVNAPGANPAAAQRYIGAVQAAVTKPVSPGGTPSNQTQAQPETGGGQTYADPVGSSIPYAGVYLEGQNAAEKAYERSQQQLLANRNTLYHRYGLTSDAQVDPYNSYGQYQQLLASEGNQLDDAYNNAVGRGIGTGGLAHQDESRLRFAQAGQNLDFQSQVDQVGQNYASGLSDAQTTRDNSMYSAERDALAAALAQMQQNGSWTPVGPSDASPPVTNKAVINDNKPLPNKKKGGSRMVMQ